MKFMLNLTSIALKRACRRSAGKRGAAGRMVFMAALFFMVVMLVAHPAVAEGKGSMQIGLAVHYLTPCRDASDFEPDPGYGAVFNYWLNSTTTILVTVEQLSFHVPLEVDGDDEGSRFTATVLGAGIRYHPELDLWIDPYFEAGLAYQSWSIDPSPRFIDARNGGSVAYFAGAGLNHEIRHSVTAGLNLRYYYLPMQEQIEREAVSFPGGGHHVTRAPLRELGFLSAGIEVEWRFK